MASFSTSYIEPQRHSHPLRIGALLILLAVTAATAAVGSIASISAQEFYLALNRPTWAPPPYLFGPVWTVLYLLMAIAAWIVVRVEGWERAKPALTLYGMQLVANGLWSWLFFKWNTGALAFAEIIVLWALIAATIVAFMRAHKLAGALLIPYLAWVSFATALTWAVWQANPGTL
ncbi:MAG: TspO/MBR family protein [Gemmatimonas sp.]